MEATDFLACATPHAWIQAAVSNVPTLLIDHANCEKKAASTALNLMYRYVDKTDLLKQLSKLAREELRHFEQVVDLMARRHLPYVHLSPSRYAGELHKLVRKQEPYRLMDEMLVAAIIEARSCERFQQLSSHLDPELNEFYLSLLKSEARHFNVYMRMAHRYAADEGMQERLQSLLAAERQLIETPDESFRFHSGIPIGTS